MNQSNTKKFVVVVKRDCPTCELIEPALKQLTNQYQNELVIYVQDDPSFPESIEQKMDDTSLEFSYTHNIEIVPTLICFNDDEEVERTFGWDKSEWQRLTGINSLGASLTNFKPGCGSKTQDPGMEEQLIARFEKNLLSSRNIELAESEDEMESCFDRGWSDGLPVIPPTAVRVIRMLKQTSRSPDEIIGKIPANKV